MMQQFDRLAFAGKSIEIEKSRQLASQLDDLVKELEKQC